jgi:hypothetical protein
MKLFTNADLVPFSTLDVIPNALGTIYAERAELVHAPLWWHKQGLTQTASGYGRKLTTENKINFCGKLYRLYVTIYSNVGSVWFTVKGKKIFVS